jgi:replicative DNA helicase
MLDTFLPPTATPAQIPHSREAEEAVIGAVMINPEIYYDVAEFLQATDFYIHRHVWIWEAFTRLNQRRTPIDLLTLSEEIDRAGRLADAGGPAYLTSLVNQVPSSLNAESYGRIVEGHALRRRMIQAANKIATLAYDESLETTVAMEKSAVVFEDTLLRRTGVGLTSLSGHLSSAYDRIDLSSRTKELPGIATGLVDLDRKLGNLQRGTLYVVAGRPGRGKTSLKLTFAQNAALADKRVAVFSLEMSNEKITNRLLAQETGLDSQLIDSGKISDGDWPKLTAAIERMDNWNIFLDDTPAITPMQIKNRCRRAMGSGALDLVIVDYLQLMGGGDAIRVDNRTQEIGYFTRALKQLSKELDVPIVVGAQLSRAVEQRADKRPQLSDLRESGDIEADADVVMFLHTPDPTIQSLAIPTELIIEKHRNGPTGSVNINFLRSATKFVNLTAGMNSGGKT